MWTPPGQPGGAPVPPPPPRREGVSPLVAGVVALALLLVAGAGVGIYNLIQVLTTDPGTGGTGTSPAEAAAAAGCGEVTEYPEAGKIHIAPDEEPADWNSNPPTSGQHTLETAAAGFHEVEQDERAVVHSLEHGYVAIQFRNLPDGEVERLRSIAAERPGAKLIVQPWSGLERDGVALTAWQVGQHCERVSEEAINAFLDAYMAPVGRESKAPEPFGA